MRMNGMRLAILIAWVVPVLAGCGTLSSTPFRTDAGGPTNQVAAAFDATGGEGAWQQCRYFEVTGVTTAYQDDGGFYLTEHTFHVSPALHALSISSREPQSNYVWQLVGHQFQRAQGDPDVDVSPLRKDYADYAEAVLEIMTAPIRMLEWDGRLTTGSATMMIGGRPYHTMEAGTPTGLQRVYYQNEANSRVDIIWLANSDRTSFVVVRGYDYALISGVQIPTKIELFRSGSTRQIGARLAQIDIRR
jgi:hypothetical protein